MNHYERLETERDADFQALKKAFYKRAKECHPDLHNNSSEKTEEFKLLVAAFDILSDPDKRSKYDEALSFEAGGVPQQESAQAAASQRRPSPYSASSVMDTYGDDILEELIVGNVIPKNATLATLLLDLEKTLVFMTFREGKNYYAQRRYRQAEPLLRRAVAMAPNNILYRVHLARTLAFRGAFADAKRHYKAAFAFAERRVPPQLLTNIKREYDALERVKSPLWHKIRKFFSDDKYESGLSPEEEMIEEANRALEHLAQEQGLNSRKRLK